MEVAQDSAARQEEALFQPQSYALALTLVPISMLCWGSWANTRKACPGYRFQLFYWDYALGLLVGALLWGLTLGSTGGAGLEFLSCALWHGSTPKTTEAAFYMTSRFDAQDNAVVSEVLRRQVPAGIVLKLGSSGAFVDASTGQPTMVQPFAVDAVDTTAAGDCFNGAFAVGLLEGTGPVESARFASAAAAISVTRSGAQSPMPDCTEVDSLLSNVGPAELENR